MRGLKFRGVIYLGFSAALHIFLFSALWFASSNSKPNSQQEMASALQIETLSEDDYLEKLKAKYKKAPEKQIVQMDDRLKSEIAPNAKDAKTFLSKHNQIADQNMRAAAVGKFKNVLNQGQPSSHANKVAKLFELPKDQIKAQDQHDPKATTTASGRLITPQPSRSPASLGPSGEGFSATDDYLKDVAIGAQTLLNTEEYKFYSFYSRIREALSAQWSHRVKRELQQIYASGKPMNGNEQITKVEVKLDTKGKLITAKVLNSSGHSELDRAAFEAFKAAAPFPHPPKDMINGNDQVSIKWDFVVYASEQSGVRIQVQRGGF